jgi:hypothetical protein
MRIKTDPDTVMLVAVIGSVLIGIASLFAGEVRLLALDVEANTAAAVTGPQSNTLAQAAAHTNRTDNPHAVTTAQIGAATPADIAVFSATNSPSILWSEDGTRGLDATGGVWQVTQVPLSNWVFTVVTENVLVVSNLVSAVAYPAPATGSFAVTGQPGYEDYTGEVTWIDTDRATTITISFLGVPTFTSGWDPAAGFTVNKQDAPTATETFYYAFVRMQAVTQLVDSVVFASGYAPGVSASTVTGIVTAATNNLLVGSGLTGDQATNIVVGMVGTNRMWYSLPWAGDALSLGVFKDSQTLGIGATSTAAVACQKVPIEYSGAITIRHTSNNNMGAGASSTNIAMIALYNNTAIGGAARIVGGCRNPGPGYVTCQYTFTNQASDVTTYFVFKVVSVNTGSVTNGTVRSINDFRWSPATPAEISAAGLTP